MGSERGLPSLPLFQSTLSCHGKRIHSPCVLTYLSLQQSAASVPKPRKSHYLTHPRTKFNNYDYDEWWLMLIIYMILYDYIMYSFAGTHQSAVIGLPKRCPALGLIIDNQAAFLWDQSSPQWGANSTPKAGCFEWKFLHIQHATYMEVSINGGSTPKRMLYNGKPINMVMVFLLGFMLYQLCPPSLPCTWAPDFKVQSRQSKMTSWSLSIEKLSLSSLRCIEYH